MSDYTTLLIGDVSTAQTIIAFGTLAMGVSLAAVIALMFKIYFYDMGKMYIERIKQKNLYVDTVNAYKTGLIKKTANDEGIELVYMDEEKSDIVSKLKESVEDDLKKIWILNFPFFFIALGFLDVTCCFVNSFCFIV